MPPMAFRGPGLRSHCHCTLNPNMPLVVNGCCDVCAARREGPQLGVRLTAEAAAVGGQDEASRCRAKSITRRLQHC